MATVNVAGLPENVKLSKVVFLFKRLFKKNGITSRFWIKEMSDIHGAPLKDAIVEFNSTRDAHLAIRILNGFEYKEEDMEYPLEARLEGRHDRGRPRHHSPSPEYEGRNYKYRDNYDRHQYESYGRHERERSRSPLQFESSKLDLEIELLRKQRMVIEEERRLLLERKKLELVKEFGHSAIREFRSMEQERERDRRVRPGRSHEYKPRRHSPPPRARPPPPRSRVHVKEGYGHALRVPQFVLPCKILLGEMQDLIDTLGTKKESFVLTKYIRSTLRNRIAAELEGKPIMSGVKIVGLYREKFPNSDDERLIKKYLKHIRASDVDENKQTAVKEEKNETNKIETAEPVHSPTNVKVEPEETIAPSWTKQELDTSQEEAQESDGMERAGSVESSDVALALHDKNDEDWVEGENGWDELNLNSDREGTKQ